jgi:hypothetical protein
MTRAKGRERHGQFELLRRIARPRLSYLLSVRNHPSTG